jgi:uncharacterized protein
MNSLYPLERMFFEVVRRGFPLTLRDYRDAVRAIALGYGGYTREGLLALLKKLWARNQEEVRALELLFEQLPRPSDEEVRQVAGERREAGPPRRERRVGEREVEGGQRRKQAGITIPEIEFAQSTQIGIGIPHAILREAPSEAFVLAERPAIPLRSMIVAWRRFRRIRRAGPLVKLDIAACIEEQCRVGRLVLPVLVPERANFVQLLLLVDVSPSMAALAGLVPLWRESLLEGRLGSAGVARGFLSRQRVADTRAFLNTAGAAWSPVAWLNPMPVARWRGSSADEISRWPNVSMFPMTEDGLIRAVDVLRGSRSG